MLKRTLIPALMLASTWAMTFSSGQQPDLWPRQQPYRTGHLQVSELHSIFYQCGGNPEGRAVMVLHGGPGAGCTPFYFRYFNPKVFHVVLHDQRGCGRSRPHLELRENTTAALVGDIEKLRRHLNLGKVILFGGSWGSTLALAYAEAYPGNTAGLVIRGVFTATKDEIDHYYHGGTAKFFPEDYETFLARLIADPGRGSFPSQVMDKLQTKNTADRLSFAKDWSRYEFRIAGLDSPLAEVDHMLAGPGPYISLAILENHYMANRCFLEEGQLLRDAKKLEEIPVTIINGRYDMICPPLAAYRLHKLLPRSRLVIVEKAGHSALEPGIQTALIAAMKNFEDTLGSSGSRR